MSEVSKIQATVRNSVKYGIFPVVPYICRHRQDCLTALIKHLGYVLCTLDSRILLVTVDTLVKAVTDLRQASSLHNPEICASCPLLNNAGGPRIQRMIFFQIYLLKRQPHRIRFA